MKWFISLTVILAVGYVQSKTLSGEQRDITDYQNEVLKLYQGLGSEDTHDFIRKDFPYTDKSYYTEPAVVGKFMDAYQSSFLDKEGTFNMYSYKNRHDTYRLFDVFYFAKDFDTFMKIAQWAKSELNPLQFAYAFTAAIYQRKDTQGVIPPPFFEVLPQYFTPAHIMTSAYKSMIQDVKYRKFEVNNTGYEWSWYKEHTYKEGPKPLDYDMESRLSYYREDVGMNDWYSKFFLQVAPWLSDEKYPDIQWERRGEYMYTVLKWILSKYNMERYANGLPPVEPLNFWKPIKIGYNPKLSDIQGTPLINRPDGHIPYKSNPIGVDYLDNMYQRYLGEVESYYMYNPLNESIFSLEGVHGFEFLSKLFYGISHPAIRRYYRPIYYQTLEAIDASYKSSNDVGNTASTFINFMTEQRDPLFYKALAYLDQLFEAYNQKKMPYTKHDIEFPGVTISSFDFPNLETYFERYEYDISNGVPFKKDIGKYKYLASQFRLNHKPYSYKLEINSDKDVDATIKVYFAPVYDSNQREYGFTGFSKYGMTFETFHFSLKAGNNVIERKSSGGGIVDTKETPRLKHIVEKLQRAQQRGHHVSYPTEFLRAFPANLALPRGTMDGVHYKVMAIVFPKGYSSDKIDCDDDLLVQEFNDEMFLRYPFDRPVSESLFQTPNVYFTKVSIKDITKY